MLDSMELTEMYLQFKRDEIERIARRQGLLQEIERPRRSWHPRQVLASALMHLALVIDGNARARIVEIAAR